MSFDDVANWAGLISAILLPLSGILVAVITYKRSKRAQLADAAVTDKSLDVKEREADTNYWSALVRGLTDQVMVVNDLYKESEKRHERSEAKYETLEKRLNDEVSLKQEMMAHIMQLEDLIPNPPGPPRRPWL